MMSSLVVSMAGVVTVRLSATFTTLKPTDLLQDREAAGRSLVAFADITVTMTTSRGNTFRAGTSLDLGEGVLQAGQWVFSVSVLLSLLPLVSALTSQKVLAWTDGKSVDKVVFVPGRYLVSVVVKD